MRKFWLKYCLYGCILGLMGRKIWSRAHEKGKIDLRPAFQPDSSVPTLDPVDSYQNIEPIGTGYARRPIYRHDELNQPVADYIVCNGKTYRNAAELFQEMEMQALNGDSGPKYDDITITKSGGKDAVPLGRHMRAGQNKKLKKMLDGAKQLNYI